MKNLNKKGFTLIELLAVIAILAILFMLVTPNILKMFTSGRKQAFKTQVQSVSRAASQQYMSDAFQGTAGPYCTGDGGKKLDLTNNGDLQYYVGFDSDGNISKLIVIDTAFYFDSTEESTVSPDKMDDFNTPGTGWSINCETGEIVK